MPVRGRDLQVRVQALGEAFQLLRLHKHMAPGDVAERAGVSEQVVVRAEAGDLDLLSLEIVFSLTVEGMDARLGELGHLTDQYLGRT